MSKTGNLGLKEEVELATGASGAVIAVDQVIKSTEPDGNQMDQLLKAGVGAAVAIGVYKLLRRADHGPDSPVSHRRHSGSSIHSRPSSSSSNSPHHNRHLIGEVIGAYTLGKELLGDKHHHIRNLVGEAIGIAGLVQELGEKKQYEENGSK